MAVRMASTGRGVGRVAALALLAVAAVAVLPPASHVARAQFGGCSLTTLYADSADLRACLQDQADICDCEPLYPPLVEAAAPCSSLLPAAVRDLIESTDDLFTNTCNLEVPAIQCDVGAYNANATAYTACAGANPANLCVCRGEFDALLEASFDCLAEDLLPAAIEDNLRLTSTFYRENCAPAGATIEFVEASYSYTPPSREVRASAAARAVTVQLRRTGDLRTAASARVALFAGGSGAYTGVSVGVTFPEVSFEDGGEDSTQTIDVVLPLLARGLASPSVTSAVAEVGTVQGTNSALGDLVETTIEYQWPAEVRVVYPSATVQWAAADGGGSDGRRVVVVADGAAAAAASIRASLVNADGDVVQELFNATDGVAQGRAAAFWFELSDSVAAGSGYVVRVAADAIVADSQPFEIAAAGAGGAAVLEFSSWTGAGDAPTMYAGSTVSLAMRVRANAAGSILVVQAATDVAGLDDDETVAVIAVDAVGSGATAQDETVAWTVPHAWGVAGASEVRLTLSLVEGDMSDLRVVRPAAAPLARPYAFSVGDWSECSEECGAGTQTRTVECLAAVDGSARADRLCELYVPTPPRSAPCFLKTCALPAGFGAGLWGACSRPCGGGTRTRTVTCLDADGAPADPTACNTIQALGLAPAASQSCNSQPCERFEWVVGNWRHCSAQPCGTGFEFRTVTCQGELGNVDETGGACLGAAPRPASSRPCNGNCFHYMWHAGAWSACADPCGGTATSTRQVDCIDTESGNAVVADGLCSAPIRPADSRPCNTGLCADAAHWEVSEFGECSEPCGSDGVQSRTVLCVNDAGATVADSECAGSGAKPAETVACNQQACDPCEGVDCYSPNGECIAGVCVCRAGFHGGRCASTVAACPMAAADGSCCASGVTDADGDCCLGANAVLDGGGNCCPSGDVDECGVCDGEGVRDIRGDCCGAGAVLDAAGICCASGSLDACGVCDGSATTCAVRATVDLAAPDGATTLALFDGSMEAAVLADATLPGALATLLGGGTAAADVLVEEVSLAPSADPALRRALAAASFAPLDNAPLRLTFAVDNAALSVEAASAAVAAALADAANTGLTAIDGLAAAGVCGNDVCESGEACVSQGDGATLASGGECCPADCPLIATPCPLSRSGGGGAPSLPCGGPTRGACAAATGECVCYGDAGYEGVACETCAAGFTDVRGDCVPVFDVAGQPTLPPGSDSGDGSGSRSPDDDAFIGGDDPGGDPSGSGGMSGSGAASRSGSGASNDPSAQQTDDAVVAPPDGGGGIGAGWIILIVVGVMAVAVAAYRKYNGPERRRRQRAGMQRIDSEIPVGGAELHGLQPGLSGRDSPTSTSSGVRV